MPNKDIEARRKYQREYQKRWRLQNLEKCRTYNAKYIRTEKGRANSRASSQRNREKYLAESRQRVKLCSLLGSVNPQGETQWLNRAKAIQRHIRRITQNRPLTPKQLQVVGSEQELISRLLCQP